MRALSFTQPWATLIIAGIKLWETRTWPAPWLGERFLVHASKGWSKDDREFAAYLAASGILKPEHFGGGPTAKLEDMPRGMILGSIRVTGCQQNLNGIRGLELELGDFSSGRWFWKLTDLYGRPTAVKLSKPIPAKGSLQFWHPAKSLPMAEWEALVADVATTHTPDERLGFEPKPLDSDLSR